MSLGTQYNVALELLFSVLFTRHVLGRHDTDELQRFFRVFAHDIIISATIVAGALPDTGQRLRRPAYIRAWV